MKTIILSIIAITLAIGLYRSSTSYSYDAKAAVVQGVDQGASQTAADMPSAQSAAVKVQTAQTANSYSCGGSCNPATCGCSPSQCSSGGCGGSCGGR